MIEENKKITYASVVPLIGGIVLGVSEALNKQHPEYVLTYSPFKNNDSHYINYLKKNKGWGGDYIDLQEKPDYKAPYVDVVVSCCPCAGLSSYSVASSADSATNEWLYVTAEYVLSTIGPKVFWGENAPLLYSNFGKKVADKLHSIGAKYGYSLNLYYTESRLHGLCQKRPRTFYFFTKSNEAPIFRNWKREIIPIEDILRKPIRENDPMDISMNSKNPMDNGWVAYAVHASGAKDIFDLYNKFDKAQNLIVAADTYFDGGFPAATKWLNENNFAHFGNTATKKQAKLDDNKCYWAHGVTLAKGVVPSLIGTLPFTLINPFTGQFLRIRDCMRIMGMPDDFDLHHENPLKVTNHICQNVSPGVSKDMMNNILDFLEGRCDSSFSSYVKQSNRTLQYHNLIEPEKSNLQDFL